MNIEQLYLECTVIYIGIPEFKTSTYNNWKYKAYVSSILIIKKDYHDLDVFSNMLLVRFDVWFEEENVWGIIKKDYHFLDEVSNMLLVRFNVWFDEENV